MTMRWWMVRAGDNNELISEWLAKETASIGWRELGNPRRFRDRDQLIAESHRVYAEAKPRSRIQGASQVWRFANEITVNDRIITYERNTREYLIGTVIEEHRFDPTAISEYYPNVIGVKWEARRISRDLLSQKAKNSLGSIRTVFRVDPYGPEFDQVLAGNEPLTTDDGDGEPEEDASNEDFAQQAITMVEDQVDNLDPWEMQELVAGLLRAMGYQIRVSTPGPDGGVDVLAYKDAFGFERPIIKVQVKHRGSSTSAPEVQQLLGANPIDANSIFVSTGGFTSAAVSVARQNGVRLIDLSELVNLILTWYESMPNETKSLLPLRKVYVPM